MVVGAFPFGALFLTAPWLFACFFGEPWREAGILTQLLLPGLYIQAVFTPFTSLFNVLREERVHLCWAVGRLLAVIIGVLGGAKLAEVRGAAIGYSIAIGLSFVLQHSLLIWLLRLLNRELPPRKKRVKAHPIPKTS